MKYHYQHSMLLLLLPLQSCRRMSPVSINSASKDNKKRLYLKIKERCIFYKLDMTCTSTHVLCNDFTPLTSAWTPCTLE